MRTYKSATNPREFNAGYVNSVTPTVVAKWEASFRAHSAAVLASMPRRLEFAYGPHPRQQLDFFPAQSAAADAPTLIAIHGGIWFLFDRWMMHFLVPAFTAAGVNVVCPSYRLAPQNNLDAIVGDCIEMVTFLHRQSGPLKLDMDTTSVMGHSAAGQLAAVLASVDWRERTGDPSFRGFRSFIGVSGFYDIEPFALTDFQRMVKFTPEEYRRWNPIDLVKPRMPPALLITGGKESAWLHEMCTVYGDRLRDAGAEPALIDAPDECHFSVLSRVGEPGSPLHRAVLNLL